MEDSRLTQPDEPSREEVNRVRAVIDRFDGKLEELDKELAVLREENLADDVNRQIIEYETAMKRNAADLAAEDAMDNIVRLENQLKIALRRNQLLSREGNVQQKQLRDRSKMLESASHELDKVREVTGWHESFEDVDYEDIERQYGTVHQMAALEAQVRQELKSAKVIIKKKEDAILKMQSQVDSVKEKENGLNKLYNDILVKQRDCREQEAKLLRMRADDGHMDRALMKLQESDDSVLNSVECMEADKEFLTDAVTNLKVATRRQDAVVRAQMVRQEQLQHRLGIVMQALGEMKLERAFERNVAKSALVPSASREEPADVSSVLPEEERIPIDTYRLLYKNNEIMRTNVARKNMLVLEKESVIQAMEAKLGGLIDMHNVRAREEDGAAVGKTREMNALLGNLQEKHQQYRGEVDKLTTENLALKLEMSRKRMGARRAPAARQQ